MTYMMNGNGRVRKPSRACHSPRASTCTHPPTRRHEASTETMTIVVREDARALLNI